MFRTSFKHALAERAATADVDTEVVCKRTAITPSVLICMQPQCALLAFNNLDHKLSKSWTVLNFISSVINMILHIEALCTQPTNMHCNESVTTEHPTSQM